MVKTKVMKLKLPVPIFMLSTEIECYLDICSKSIPAKWSENEAIFAFHAGYTCILHNWPLWGRECRAVSITYVICKDYVIREARSGSARDRPI